MRFNLGLVGDVLGHDFQPMNIIREKQRYLKQENQKYQAGVFTEIPRASWPAYRTEIPIVKVFRSRDFLVQVYGGELVRLSICRTQLGNDGKNLDHISWEEMQAIKRGCGYGEADAVEAYPADCDIVNVANMRHLWIVPSAYASFFWRAGKGSGWKSGDTAEQLLGEP
jgi:hypothetical protein